MPASGKYLGSYRTTGACAVVSEASGERLHQSSNNTCRQAFSITSRRLLQTLDRKLEAGGSGADALGNCRLWIVECGLAEGPQIHNPQSTIQNFRYIHHVTESELDAFASAFQSCAIPKSEWTHQAHLKVGTWHVRRFGKDEALERLRIGIRRLNDSHGVPNSDTRGYHETITRV